MKNKIHLKTTTDTSKNERSDAVANRKRILAATQQLCDEYGPDQVNMSDVVQAAGIGRGTLYRHFPTKGELCLALIDEQIAAFQNKTLDQLRQMTLQQESPMTQLDAFLHELVSFTEAHAPLLREAQNQGTYELEKKVAPENWRYATVHWLLEAARESGEIANDLDIDYLSDTILFLLNAQLFHFLREQRGFAPERISDGLRAWVARLRSVG